MDSPDPSDGSLSSVTTRATFARLGMVGTYIQLAALTGFWMSVAGLSHLLPIGLRPLSGYLLSLPLAIASFGASVLLLVLAWFPRAKPRWSEAAALGVALAYGLSLAAVDDPGLMGRPIASGLAAALLISAALLQARSLRRTAPWPRPLTGAGLCTAVLGSLVSVFGAQMLVDHHRLDAQYHARQLSHELIYRTSRGMAESSGWLRRLADRWSILAHPPSITLLNQELRSYLRDSPVFRELAVIDGDEVVLALGTPSATGARPPLGERDALLPSAAQARDTAQLIRHPAELLGPNDIESLLLVPVSRDDASALVIAGTVTLHHVLDEVALRSPQGFDFRVLRDDEPAYSTTPHWPRRAAVQGRMPLPLDDTLRWQIEYAYRSAQAWPLARVFPETLLLAGLIFTFCLIVAQQLGRLARQRAGQLHHGALHDPLTGLPNRSQLEQTLILARRELHDAPGTMAVILIDLDGIKLVNDSMGHLAGDRILLEAARRLRHRMGQIGFVARLGGDEFVVVLRDPQAADAEPLAQAILADLARPYSIDGTWLRITASAGLSSGGETEDPMQWVREADLAMVRAKQEGRNTWRRYTSDMSGDLAQRLAMRSHLQDALDQKQMDLHYQPIVEGRTGKVVGIEALLRWRHDTLGDIAPDRFLPLAEDTGQIVPLSDWVLQRACEQAAILRQSGQAELPVIINVSPLYFRREEFIDTVKRNLAAAELPSENLQMEITERLLASDGDRASRLLARLRGLGVKVSIDDFGTGYSSFSALKNLPVDKIKIDGSFIANVVDNADDAAIVQGIIAMAHHLGLRVVAEGVETEAQFAFLRQHQCDEYQGFLFCRPLAFAALQEWLRDHDGSVPPPQA
ncbi:MAG: bifunctional diguanylate cyclase/phosphodiesterase [Pigmentiphaga sp.]|nr:bifunctional diguanylate cyclase/phosphodiesterase [Pigmentiphaga sp.]